MKSFAVIGGSGTVGRGICRALEDSGSQVRVLGRSSPEFPVDLTSGAGLEGALEGVDVVVDASNGSPRNPEPLLPDAQRLLLEAEQRAGVGHHLCVSIVGIDKVPTRYYLAKLGQEGVVSTGPVPFTIARSTQFHELVDFGLASFARLRLHPLAAITLQPIAAEEAGAKIAEIAMREPEGRTVTIAGPELLTLRELAAARAEATGRRTFPAPFPLLPSIARPLNRGALTAADPDLQGSITWKSWLAAAVSS